MATTQGQLINSDYVRVFAADLAGAPRGATCRGRHLQHLRPVLPVGHVAAALRRLVIESAEEFAAFLDDPVGEPDSLA